jgi:hypothetical protein
VENVMRIDGLDRRDIVRRGLPYLHPLTERTRAPRDRGCASAP